MFTKKNFFKVIILVISLVLLVGCESLIDNKNSITDFVKSHSYSDVYSKIDESVMKIQMFPSEEYENDFIYYVMAIKANYEKFNTNEIENLYNKLNFQYDFSFNTLKYTRNDYENDLMFLKSKIM